MVFVGIIGPMGEYCFLNGEIILLADAKVSILDIGLLRGYGMYEAMPAFGGKVFRFADHWNRFLDGAHTLALNVPVTEDGAKKKIEELLNKNGHIKRGNVKLILTGGNIINSLEYDFEKPTFFIVTEQHKPVQNDIYTGGGKLVTYKYQRSMPESKTIDYIKAVQLQELRKDEGAIEVLYTNDGEITECTTSNIFIVKDGKIITPAENILKGITRKVVIELVKNLACPELALGETEERIVYEKELQEADEVFITSSFKDIVPIVEIDGFKVGDGKVGEVTKALMESLNSYIEGYIAE